MRGRSPSARHRRQSRRRRRKGPGGPRAPDAMCQAVGSHRKLFRVRRLLGTLPNAQNRHKAGFKDGGSKWELVGLPGGRGTLWAGNDGREGPAGSRQPRLSLFGP